jgi:hypothetical protein
VFIACTVDIGDMSFTGVNDTGNKLLPVSLLPMDKFMAGVVKLVIKLCLSSIP